MPGFDMHIHTKASDGLLDIAQIVSKAKEKDLDGIAITDHDTIAALDEAAKIKEETHFPIIPGIELSAEWGNFNVHILGYWIDWKKSFLAERLDILQQARRERCYHIVELLEKHDMPLDADKIIAVSGSSIGRPHIAAAMLEKGYVKSSKESFSKWIGRGMPAYVPRLKLSPFEAIEMIREANGVAVLAHPGVGVPEKLIPELVIEGLSGIEVHHPDHNYQAETKFYQIARHYCLAALGGSDFHGHPSRVIGCRFTSLDQVELLARRGHRQGISLG